MIRLERVGLRAPGGASGADRPTLLDAIDLEVRRGEFVAIVGPNGAGKSLLLQVLAGIRSPTTGTVHREPTDLRVALVFQAPDDQIVGSTVERDLAFGLENLAVPPDEMRPRVDAMLDRIDLADRRHDPPHLLSEGEKQRLALGAALLMEPALLLLDEPTSRLDAESRHRFLEEVHRTRRDTGAAVVQVTHRSEEALPAERIVGIAGGQILFDGSAQDLMRSAHVDSLGIRWSELHQFRRELAGCGVEVAPAESEWWNDPEVLLEQLGVTGSET